MVEVGEDREWSGDEKHDNGGEVEEKNVAATEYVFRNTDVPSWKEQLTLRSMVTSLVLSVVFNFIVCKLNLTTGVIPSLNVAAGLLAFSMIKSWTTALHRMGFLVRPFTRQENTVVQTCVVASSGIAFSSTVNFLLLIQQLFCKP